MIFLFSLFNDGSLLSVLACKHIMQVRYDTTLQYFLLESLQISRQDDGWWWWCVWRETVCVRRLSSFCRGCINAKIWLLRLLLTSVNQTASPEQTQRAAGRRAGGCWMSCHGDGSCHFVDQSQNAAGSVCLSRTTQTLLAATKRNLYFLQDRDRGGQGRTVCCSLSNTC